MSKKVAFEMKVKFKDVEILKDPDIGFCVNRVIVGLEDEDNESCICVDVANGQEDMPDENDPSIIKFIGESNETDFVAHCLFDILNDIEAVGAEFSSNLDKFTDEIDTVLSFKLDGYEDGVLTKTFIADEDMLDEFELFD